MSTSVWPMFAQSPFRRSNDVLRCACAGDLDGVREFVLSGKIDVNEKGAQDRTALHR